METGRERRERIELAAERIGGGRGEFSVEGGGVGGG